MENILGDPMTITADTLARDYELCAVDECEFIWITNSRAIPLRRKRSYLAAVTVGIILALIGIASVILAILIVTS